MATVTEIQAEITEINTALSHIRNGGQSYMIMTAAGGGSQRTVTMADYDKLLKHRNQLQAELDSINGERAVKMRPAW